MGVPGTAKDKETVALPKVPKGRFHDILKGHFFSIFQ
jgi:hypothetical protein